MDVSKIKTVADFNGLSLSEKIWFKDNFRDSFVQLFVQGNSQAPVAITNTKSVGSVVLDASSVRTPDDFEKLTDVEKLAFRDNHNEHYRKLFSGNV